MEQEFPPDATRCVTTKPATARLPRAEKVLIFVLLAVALVLRVFFALRFAIDSDEPQHLHVVRNWVHGLVQYRDFFDNHAPLFHLLMAPLCGLLGDSPDLVLKMRLAMIPFYAGAVWGAWAIGRTVLSRRVAAWTAVFVALYPPLFKVAVGFRTDQLWMMLWLISIALLVRGRLGPWRALAAGLVLGAATGVSFKTSFLLAGLAAAGLAVLVVCWKRLPRPGLSRRAALTAGAILIGTLAVPVAIGLTFWVTGDWRQFWYCTIEHNMVKADESAAKLWTAVFVPLAAVLCWLVSRPLAANAPSVGVGVRRVFILFLAGLSLVIFWVSWPDITAQSWLPIYPLAVIMGVLIAAAAPSEAAGRALGRLRISPERWPLIAGLAVSAIWLAWLLAYAPYKDATAADRRFWADVLKLTDPSDTVMDLKGETIFRRRACREVFETLTRDRIKHGLMADTIPEQVIVSRAVICTSTHRLPPRGEEFLKRNFVPIGDLNVLGRFLVPVDRRGIQFTVEVPANYTVVTPAGRGAGTLDGVPVSGSKFLDAGEHVYAPAAGEDKIALVWAQAIQRGYQPLWSWWGKDR